MTTHRRTVTGLLASLAAGGVIWCASGDLHAATTSPATNDEARQIVTVATNRAAAATNGKSDEDARLLSEVRANAEKGDAKSQLALGCAFYTGLLGLERDYAEAVKWLRKAAEQSSATAQSHLGFCYANGEGVAEDYAEAMKWWRKAAEQNEASAQFALGGCYVAGKGVGKDDIEAVKWFRKAAEQNYPAAQDALAGCCATGRGVAQDYAEAYKWLLLSAAQGNKDAKQDMALLEGRLTPDQNAAGIKRAQDFKPKGAIPAGSEGPGAGISK